jgi:glycerol-3-phosphate dehydrogenase
MSRDLDIVIIGGGMQGLLALDTLIERGYACALVNDGPLGEWVHRICIAAAATA